MEAEGLVSTCPEMHCGLQFGGTHSFSRYARLSDFLFTTDMIYTKRNIAWWPLKSRHKRERQYRSVTVLKITLDERSHSSRRLINIQVGYLFLAQILFAINMSNGKTN